jgi:hypothetical protein
LDIIIELKNVSQVFKPEVISFQMLLNKVDYHYTEAFKPLTLDGRVRFLFWPAKVFEAFARTDYILPTEPVNVIIYPKWVKSGMQLPMIKDFSDQAAEIAYYVKVFLQNTNNNNLLLPANIAIGTGSKSYTFPVETTSLSQVEEPISKGRSPI